jgi:pimeloyl-ACP methyl ester carboxylesterase
LLERRALLITGAAATLFSRATVGYGADPASEASPKRLLLVHGRDQQGQDPALLKAAWLDALGKGAGPSGRSLPAGVKVAFPFYGDVIDQYAKSSQIPLLADLRAKGTGSPDAGFLAFEAALAEDIRLGAGISDQQVASEYSGDVRQKGPENWEWVEAIVRAVDKHWPGASQTLIEQFMRDVYIYTTLAGVRDEIDRIVRAELTTERTVVVGHSLGSVVAYNILRTDPRSLNVALYLTVGSPLAIRAIREQLRPLRSPAGVHRWFNAFDPHDVVALNPLDQRNFPVTPAIENYGQVKNHTANHHSIGGYLDDRTVATQLLDAIGA